MKQYKKREEYVTAVKYTGDYTKLKEILNEESYNSIAVIQINKSLKIKLQDECKGLHIFSLSDTIVKLGDYVIRKDDGESRYFKVMSPEDFANTYEI